VNSIVFSDTSLIQTQVSGLVQALPLTDPYQTHRQTIGHLISLVWRSL